MFIQLQHSWSLLCYLSPAFVLVISCWPGTDEFRFRVCSCLHAVPLAILFLVSMNLWSLYNCYLSHIRDGFLSGSIDIGTYLRLNLLLGCAKEDR